MALTDVNVKSGINATANGASWNIQPPVGEEWVIHNIYYSQACAFRIVGPGVVLGFDSDTSAGARLGIAIHVTNTQYLQILNSYAGANNMAYDGVQTK